MGLRSHKTTKIPSSSNMEYCGDPALLYTMRRVDCKQCNFIDQWTKDVMHHRSIPKLKKFLRTIRKHKSLILSYFYAKKEVTSGIVEGFNNKAKLTIGKSYGFRSDKLRKMDLY